MDLRDVEQDLSQEFYTAYFSSMRSLMLLFDRVLYKDHFITLPGDGISEKKHKNNKRLVAQERNEDINRKEMRKF
jgi:hypothetical protein